MHARGDCGYAAAEARMHAAVHPDDRGPSGLAERLAGCRRIVCLTGAGCSTASGIPDYRDAGGGWKCRQPITWQQFAATQTARQRYWAGSMRGWPAVARARPNAAHAALAALEGAGRIDHLITQNVDGLHRQAGQRRLTELHGRLDRVRCTGCGHVLGRDRLQARLEALNPQWLECSDPIAPDGDAAITAECTEFRVPPCPRCGGVLRPDVVFFGETVAKEVVAASLQRVATADALLVVGSSLMVWSGYRFVRAARAAGVPVYCVNLGRTRADAELHFKVEAPCEQVLPALVPILS